MTTGIEPCSPGSQPGALPLSYSHSFASWIRTTISAFKAPRPAVRRRQNKSGRPEKKKPRRIARAVIVSLRICYCKSMSNIRTRLNSPSRGCWSRCCCMFKMFIQQRLYFFLNDQNYLPYFIVVGDAFPNLKFIRAYILSNRLPSIYPRGGGKF